MDRKINDLEANDNKNSIVPCDAPFDNSNSIEQQGGYYYELFRFFSEQHDLILVDTELQDIIHAVEKFNNDPIRKVINDGKN